MCKEMRDQIKQPCILQGDYTTPEFKEGTFLWALDQAMNGNKVTYGLWEYSKYMVMSGTGLKNFFQGELIDIQHITPTMIQATDWKLYNSEAITQCSLVKWRLVHKDRASETLTFECIEFGPFSLTHKGKIESSEGMYWLSVGDVVRVPQKCTEVEFARRLQDKINEVKSNPNAFKVAQEEFNKLNNEIIDNVVRHGTNIFILPTKACECGASKLGYKSHSHWCPMSGE